MLVECGALADLIAAGARILECACGPCIGMGFSPKSAGVSLRTFNRNFLARSGTADAEVYLVSPETAAASAIAGVFCDPTVLGKAPVINIPKIFNVNDNLIEMPATEKEAEDNSRISPRAAKHCRCGDSGDVAYAVVVCSHEVADGTAYCH